MDIMIKRDGIILKGKLEKPDVDKCPIVILFHGFAGDLGYNEDSLFTIISNKLIKENIAVIRFDFNGQGKSSGDFSNMDPLNEIEDAITILKYVKKIKFITDIYVLGHSQGGVIGGMLAGYYSDIIKKLVLLAPAATLREDAEMGTCMGTKYNTKHIPPIVAINNNELKVGGQYFRIAKYLPIYEVTKNFKNPTLVIHGVDDNIVNVKAAYRYKECMPCCELMTFQKLNHGIEGEDQERAINKVVEFLK